MAKTRKNKRGGGKVTFYSAKNKTVRSAKPSAHMSHKPKTQRQSFLKTLKTPAKKPEVTPDKYLQGIIKFLNKIENTNVNSKSYDLYIGVLQYINAAAKDAMKDISGETKNYNSNDVEQLKEDIEILIEEYHDSTNKNDKHTYEIQMYTLANAIMESINEAKKELKEKQPNNNLSNLLGKMSLKKNANDDLVSLFSGMTLKKS